MAWNYKPQEKTTAFIERNTLADAEKNAFVQEASQALLSLAKEIMAELQEAGITPQSTTKDGKQYDSKAVISVQPAVVYDKETNTEKILTRDDGKPVYSLKINIRNGDTDLSLFAKEDISNGVVLQNMVAKVWGTTEYGNPTATIYKMGELQSAPISEKTKAMASKLSERIVEKPKMEHTWASEYAYALNTEVFPKMSERVPSTSESNKGALVSNEYAKAVHDDFGDRVLLYTHDENIVVELGVTSSNERYAKAVNFDAPMIDEETGAQIMSKDGEHFVPQSMFINSAEDLDNLSNNVIKTVVASFMEFKAKEQEKQAAKKDQKTPKKNKSDVERN